LFFWVIHRWLHCTVQPTTLHFVPVIVNAHFVPSIKIQFNPILAHRKLIKQKNKTKDHPNLFSSRQMKRKMGELVMLFSICPFQNNLRGFLSNFNCLIRQNGAIHHEFWHNQLNNTNLGMAQFGLGGTINQPDGQVKAATKKE
jgi:hypothetical protein